MLKTSGQKEAAGVAAPEAVAVAPVAGARAEAAQEAAAQEVAVQEAGAQEAGAQGARVVRELGAARAGAARAERLLVLAVPVEGPASAASPRPGDFLRTRASMREAPVG
jgi:hypothetical protein